LTLAAADIVITVKALRENNDTRTVAGILYGVRMRVSAASLSAIGARSRDTAVKLPV
jgi:hypothetical protein